MTEFDSNEEMYTYWWLKELQDKGFIIKIERAESYSLSSGLKIPFFTPYKKKAGGSFTEEEVLGPHVYTPDYYIEWSEKAIEVFTIDLYSVERKKKNRSFQYVISQKNDKDEMFSVIEVKPSFDQNNMTRAAKINIKWVWEKHNEFVNIIIPEKHFEKTFTPQKYLFTNLSKKPRKIKYKNILTLDQFVKSKRSESTSFEQQPLIPNK